MQQITISPDFFAREVSQVYADKDLAFVRELVQNAVDAGASHLRFHFNTKNRCFSILDNGHGMSENICRDVYLALGCTSKSADEIGGFGRARILTCFVHRKYVLRSADYLLIGEGTSYTIKKMPYIEGLRLHVWLNENFVPDYVRNGIWQMVAGSTKFPQFKATQDKQETYVSGVGHSINATLKECTKKIEDNGNTVYLCKSPSEYSPVIILIDGLFSCKYYAGKLGGRVVFNLAPTEARKLLNPSRDSVKDTSYFEPFISTLRNNTADDYKKPCPVEINTFGAINTTSSRFENIYKYDELLLLSFGGSIYKKDAQKFIDYCATAMRYFAKQENETFKWTIGWTNDPELEGFCYTHNTDDGPVCVFVINGNKLRGHKHIKAIAMHECCHAVEKEHNARFASKLTQLIEYMG